MDSTPQFQPLPPQPLQQQIPVVAPATPAVPAKSEGKIFKILTQILLYLCIFLSGFVAAKIHTLVTSL